MFHIVTKKPSLAENNPDRRNTSAADSTIVQTELLFWLGVRDAVASFRDVLFEPQSSPRRERSTTALHFNTGFRIVLPSFSATSNSTRLPACFSLSCCADRFTDSLIAS